MKVDEKTFNQAVTIAAAFIANGDIRCGGNTRNNSTAMEMLGDFLPSIYHVITNAKEAIKMGAD